jgi:predicted nucleic acid-binding protein
MSLVVDASVACKWFIEEAGSREARKVLQGGALLLAPDLLIPEVCSVAWKKLRAGQVALAQASAMIDALPLMFVQLVPAARLSARALAIGAALDHPVYDCFYLAAAEAERCGMVTADARLLQRLSGTEWGGQVRGLGA